MKAMVLKGVCDLRQNKKPLSAAKMPDPVAGRGEVLLEIAACGVCHTEIDEIEGRTPPPVYPVIPGHQIVGRVRACGPDALLHKEGDRVGVAWIHSACGQCEHCRGGQENLCPDFQATGRDVHGGYAQLVTVPEQFALPIPEVFTDSQAAPLLCAGAIGYRSLRLTGMKNGQRLGLTGFGASGHLVLKLVRHRYPDSAVYVFARNPAEREFALELGAVWVGDIHHQAPEGLDCIIDTTPAWKPVVEALKNLKAGGRLVINAIRKESFDKQELLRLDYHIHLWMEKEIKSVANVARRDVTEFLQIAADIPFLPEVQEYSLEAANTALVELKEGRIRGAKVLNLESA